MADHGNLAHKHLCSQRGQRHRAPQDQVHHTRHGGQASILLALYRRSIARPAARRRGGGGGGCGGCRRAGRRRSSPACRGGSRRSAPCPRHRSGCVQRFHTGSPNIYHWPATNADELNAAVLGPTHPLVRGPPARGVGLDRPRRHCRSKPYPGTAPARPSERRVLVHMRPRNPPSEPLTAPTTATAPDSSVTTASVDRSLIGEPISRMRTARP